ncbi:MAG: FAD-dependent oxidoreductase [Acidimicrobiales bacterium]
MGTSSHHKVLIVGGGTAGITTAARLLRKIDSVAVMDPSDDHYYQPLWTLVGGGCVKASSTKRSQASVIPKGADWIKEAAVEIEPENNVVRTDAGSSYSYDALVLCPGIQLDWDLVPGVTETLGKNGVSSNYSFELAPKTWDFIRNTRSGTAVFAMPNGAIKCGGAPQKIAYLACDYWRSQGVLDKIDVHLVVPGPRIFGLSEFADSLDQVIADYGINLHTGAALESIDPDGKKATFGGSDTASAFSLPYDVLHLAPPQSAPDWVKASPLSDESPGGWVDVDKYTLQHNRYSNVFSLGDAGSTPNGKTGAAVRKQAPVVVENLRAMFDEQPLTAEYHGYSSCPIVTSRDRVLLAEFDYDGNHTPTFPLIDLTKPRRDMWYLKRYGLPFLYWNLMLKGRA